MENIFVNSINLGILVEKEIVVHIDHKANGDSPTTHRPSVISVARSLSDLERQTQVSEVRQTTSSLPLSPSPGKMLPRPDVNQGRHADLVNFLRRPPPSDNFMSIPDDASISSDRDKWDALKVFGKKRKRRKRRQPPLIKLPDSAISARTIEGHRYIAIAIPIDYAPSRPVSSHSLGAGLRETTTRQAANNTRSRASGLRLRVLNPVLEGCESLSTISLAPRPATPGILSLLPTIPSQEEPLSGKGKEPEGSKSRQSAMSPLDSARASSATIRGPRLINSGQGQISEENDAEKVPRVVDIPSRKETTRISRQEETAQSSNEPITSNYLVPPKSERRSLSRSPGPPRILSANPLVTLTLPIRTSSRRACTTIIEPGEGENIISNRPAPLSRGVSSNTGGNGNGGGTPGARASFAESLMTDSSPKLLKAQTATAHQPANIVVRPPSRPEIDSPLNLNFPRPPSLSRVSRSVQTDLPRRQRGTSEKTTTSPSRKERVRERKQRDMERHKAQLRQAKHATSNQPRLEVPPQNIWPESPVLGRFNEDLASPASSSRPFHTAIAFDRRPGKEQKSHPYPHLSADASFPSRRRRSASAPVMTSSSSPPPSSSSPPLEAWEHSTAYYYRRRQRQAEREEHEARRARHAAQTLAEERDRAAHLQMRRRHERLKETRARDLETRLARLERNGDVLLRSLASLMDTLNQVLRERTASVPQMPTQGRGQERRRSRSLTSVRSLDRSLGGSGLRWGQRQEGGGGGDESRFRRNRPADLDLGPRREAEAPARPLGQAETSEREPGFRGSQGECEGVRQSALEALQEHLRSQTQLRQRDQGLGMSGYTSSSISEEGSLEVMEPLMRELQGAAGFGGRPEGEERTPLTESEVFNLF
ncbi:hypothetical protein M426DRAFT_23280 [Hypoxylon sp. CI-4A]|nr:hypothetical protein M426DRAFT_23280 [Hypoxylon sp. CI-4A]